MENKDNVILKTVVDETQIKITDPNIICRICANQSDTLIKIFNDDGSLSDLANKINTYLPIKIKKGDSLPLNCCMICVATLTEWHNLTIICIENDKRFKHYQFLSYFKEEENKYLTEERSNNQEYTESSNNQDYTESFNNQEYTESSNIQEYNESIQDFLTSTSLNNDFCQTNLNEDKSQIQFFNFESTPSSSSSSPSSSSSSLKNHQVITNNHSGSINDFNIDSKNEKTNIKNNNNDNYVIMQQQKDNNEYYVCLLCPSEILLKEYVNNHLETQHPNQKIKIESKNERSLDKLETGKKPELKQQQRKKLNKIDQNLINTAKVIVDGRIYYNCKECGKSLHSPYTYLWHRRIHTGERPYICDLCGKQFRVSQGLVRHLRETHEGIKKFPCDLCGRMFSTRRNVEEHRRIHTNERPYICDICGKTFKQKASLFVHKRSHKNLFPFKCVYCNQAFRTKPTLMVHITRHTGEKPYKCDVCGRCFRIKYELKRHLLIHSEVKPFCCTLCGLEFRQKRYLRNHTKIYHSNKNE